MIAFHRLLIYYVICLDESIPQNSGDCGIVRDGKTQAVNCESKRYVSCKINGKLQHLIKTYIKGSVNRFVKIMK